MMKLPIGYSDFKQIRDLGLRYVDKTLFIKELLESPTQVSLLLRPRRFGKTLLLSMLKYFFEKTEKPQENRYLFNDLKIMKTDERFTQHCGKHPVIFMTFKDVKADNFKDAYASIKIIIRRLYAEHRELLTSDKLYEEEKERYHLILSQKAPFELIKASLKDLTDYIARVYGINPIVLIDEYDIPIQTSYEHGYYSEMIKIMRELYSDVLKDNPYLERAVLTGILKIAKENIFSGLNNLKVYSSLETSYSEYFGFTESEVTELLNQFELQQKANDIQAWYNGYQFGNTVIYNPWSIINCIDEKGQLKPYWVNTSSNKLIKRLIVELNHDFKKDIEQLLMGDEIQTYIDLDIIFDDLGRHKTSIWTLFLMSGYLKTTSCESKGDQYACILKIPNQEVMSLYSRIMKNWFFGEKSIKWYNQFLDYIRQGNIKEFTKGLQELANEMFSYHDVPKESKRLEPENFYHGFAMGLIASLRDEYYIESNKESGFGRYDLAIIPKTKSKSPAIIFEFKSSKGQADKTLKKTAQEALTQIEMKRYEAAIKKFKPESVLNVGIAFSGKKVWIEHRASKKLR